MKCGTTELFLENFHRSTCPIAFHCHEKRLLLRQVCDTMPGGAWHVNDPKNYPPPKTTVLTKMEELIHHFIIHTAGLKAPVGEVYFGAENPKGELGFYIYSKGGGTPYRLKIRSPSFINLSILPKLLPGHMMSDRPGFRCGRIGFGRLAQRVANH